MKLLIALIILLKLPAAQAPAHLKTWIVWNVGQGQWMTLVQNDSCHHFDFGGEIFALKTIQHPLTHLCRNKINRLSLSHADWDHYAFHDFILRRLMNVCWYSKPQGRLKQKLKIIENEIPFCALSIEKIHQLYPSVSGSLSDKNRNKNSVIVVSNPWLIPGDSPTQMEKKWLKLLPHNVRVTHLMVGHHGSRTSTSEHLMRKLTSLQQAVVSSRAKKYGHPHKEVTVRLKKYLIPVLKTEDWGNIQFY